MGDYNCMVALELKQFIYDNNKIEYILEDLGCTNIVCHSEKGFISACQPTGNNPMGVVIKNCSNLNYYSYSRNIHIEEGKDIFNLIQDIKKIKFADAIKYTHKILGLKYEYSEKKVEAPKYDLNALFKKAQSKRKRICNIGDIEYLDEHILSDFYPGIHINLFREGIIKKTIEKFNLGYSYKWKRTIFPHYYWLTGQLLGYNARTSVDNYELFNIPKYFITPGMKKEVNLYGLYQNMEEIEKQHIIVIGESEKNVLKRDSRGDSTWVALSGKSISEEQVRIILGLNIHEVVVALDKDVPIEEIWSICERFYRKRKVSYIWDKYDLLQKKDSVADASNKVYDYLFKHRVVYDEKEHQEYLKRLHE
jgi:DNA primase